MSPMATGAADGHDRAMNTTPPDSGSGGTGTYQQPPRAPWRFVRRERGRMIAGVATGMADAFHVDVVVMRVIWVVVTLASFGLGVAAYAICWLAFPSDQHPAPLGDGWRGHRGSRLKNAGYVVGLALLALGLIIAFGQIFRPFRHGGGVVWATLLIGIGLAVLFLRQPDDHGPVTPPGPWSAVPGAPTAPPTGEHPGGPGPAPSAPPEGPGSAPAWPPPPPMLAPPGLTPPTPPSAWTQSAPWPVAPTPRVRPPRPRSFLTPLTCSLLLIGAGIATLLDNNGSAHLTAAEILAGGVTIVGVALLVSTWFGRARGLLPIGILLLVATLPAAVIDVPLTGGTGSHEYRPISLAGIRPKYEMGIGRLALDFTAAPLAGRTTHVHAQIGIGELVVDVPSTVRVVVDAHAGAGSLQLFGDNQGGWRDRQTRTAAGTGAGELDLDLRVGAGDVVVRRFEPNGAETLLPGGIR